MADDPHLCAILACVDRLESQSRPHLLRDKTNVVAAARTRLIVHVAGKQTDAVLYNRNTTKFTKGSNLIRSLPKEDPFVATLHGGYPFAAPVTPYALQSIGPMWSTGDLTLKLLLQMIPPCTRRAPSCIYAYSHLCPFYRLLYCITYSKPVSTAATQSARVPHSSEVTIAQRVRADEQAGSAHEVVSVLVCI